MLLNKKLQKYPAIRIFYHLFQKILFYKYKMSICLSEILNTQINLPIGQASLLNK